MRIGRTGKLLAMLSVAALAVSTAGVPPSAAASAGVSAKQAVAPVGAAQAQTDEVSARKRQRHVRHYRSGNGAALRTFGAIAGTIGGIIAADQARRAYRYYGPCDGYGYYPYAYQPYGYYGGYSYY